MLDFEQSEENLYFDLVEMVMHLRSTILNAPILQVTGFMNKWIHEETLKKHS